MTRYLAQSAIGAHSCVAGHSVVSALLDSDRYQVHTVTCERILDYRSSSSHIQLRQLRRLLPSSLLFLRNSLLISSFILSAGLAIVIDISVLILLLLIWRGRCKTIDLFFLSRLIIRKWNITDFRQNNCELNFKTYLSTVSTPKGS